MQMVALLLVLAAGGYWAVAGANPGWSRNRVPAKTLDEVTGIEAITYEKKFVPGVDFLGAAALGAALLTGLSLLLPGRAAAGPN